MEQIAAIKLSLGAVIVASAIAAATLFWPERPEAASPAFSREEVIRELLQAKGNGSVTHCRAHLRHDALDPNFVAYQDTVQRIYVAGMKLDAIADQLRELRRTSNEADPRIKVLLDKYRQTEADARDLVATAKKQLQQARD